MRFECWQSRLSQPELQLHPIVGKIVPESGKVTRTRWSALTRSIEVTTARLRAGRLLPLLAAVAVVCVGAYLVSLSAIADMQRSRGQYVGESFGKYLVQQVPDLAAILEGQPATKTTLDALAVLKPIGSVFKFQIYDASGNLKIDATAYATAHLVLPRNSFVNLDAKAVADGGSPSFTLSPGDGRAVPAYYSEILMPLRSGSQTVGVLSVLSDESQAWPEMISQFRAVIAEVALLVIVAFGVPVVLYLRKLNQLELARRRLSHSAQHDDLTGILNRQGFLVALQDRIDEVSARGQSLAVHLIDLDRFKDINDSGGHAVGDELLQQATDRIKRLLGTRESIARLGADEFAVLQPLPTRSVGEVRDLGDRIAAALARPFVIGDRTLQSGASIGNSVYAGNGDAGIDLMRAAGVALHHAKLHARGHAIAFDPSMEAERKSRETIEGRLRQALADSQFELDFQPIFETKTGLLRGFEALLRLADTNGRPIPPAEFIPVAEEVGLIGDIGLWVLREACKVAQQWPERLFVAVNLSAAQFDSGDMAARVQDVLQWSGLRPDRLELEVTESLLITDTDKVLRELQAIKALGPSLALDDFGTGYSSLSYLWRFPVDKLKVDRSFMADVTVNGSRSREILATIVALGRVLNLTVTAEGVETEAQAALLRELDCDLVQGFLFGRPQPAADVAGIILKAFGSIELKQPVPVPGKRRSTGAA